MADQNARVFPGAAPCNLPIEQPTVRRQAADAVLTSENSETNVVHQWWRVDLVGRPTLRGLVLLRESGPRPLHRPDQPHSSGDVRYRALALKRTYAMPDMGPPFGLPEVGT